MRIYAEAGLGNDHFLSTEFEDDTQEYRLPIFKRPKNVSGYYLRIWVLKTVLIVSTNEGFKISKKDRNRLKILFGISGTE